MHPIWFYLYQSILNISELSSGEYISLIAKYNNINGNEAFDKLKDRGYTPEQINAVMKDKSFQSMKSLNIEFSEPTTLHCSEFGFYSSIYMSYLKGHLPYNGCYVDQPAKIIDVIQTLEALYSESRKKHHDEQMKEAKRKNGKK